MLCMMLDDGARASSFRNLGLNFRYVLFFKKVRARQARGADHDAAADGCGGLPHRAHVAHDAARARMTGAAIWTAARPAETQTRGEIA